MQNLLGLAFFVVLLSVPLKAGVLSSLSQSYGSRNSTLNPAALGFDTELNGAELLSSFSYGTQKYLDDEYAAALSYGNLGFSWQKQSLALGKLNRFDFALGLPVNKQIYFGTRFSLLRFESSLNDPLNQWDVGIQYRPSPWLSVGVLGKNLNHKDQSVEELSQQWSGSITLRPFRWIDLMADLSTPSNDFLNTLHYTITAAVSLSPGWKLLAGYQDPKTFLAGLQIDLGNLGFYHQSEWREDYQKLRFGIQTSLTPSPSVLNPDKGVKIDVAKNLSEMPSKGSFFGKEVPSFAELLQKIDTAARDDKAKQISVKLEKFPLGVSSAWELNQALLRAKRAGKRIEVYLSQADLKEYLIASAADKIWMEPEGELHLLGLRSQRYFVKGTLDKLGVEGEFLAHGKFKSAPEIFTRTESSPSHKDSTLHQLKIAEEIILNSIAETRPKLKADFASLLKKAVFDPESAKKEGLIDSVGSFSAEFENQKNALHWIDSYDQRRDLLHVPSRIAVVVAQGDILSEKISALSLTGKTQLTPRAIEKLLRIAINDDRTDAILLRVNSPGGEVLASDRIASLLEMAKKKKPLFISMGDVAASGGYLISLPGEQVFATPLSITGSIGVFMGKANLGNLYKKIDLKKETLTHSPYANLFGEEKPWTPEERNILMKRLNAYYDNFLKRVSNDRKIPSDKAESAAQGHVWLGQEALGLNLVDHIGGFFESTRALALKAQLDPNEPWYVIEEPKSLTEMIAGDNPFMEAPSLKEMLPASFSEELHTWVWFGKNPYLYLSPISKME